MSWTTMFVFLFKNFLKEGLSKEDSHRKASDYNFWDSMGYDHDVLNKAMLENVLNSVLDPENKYVLENNGYLQDLWKNLNKKRATLPKSVSISYGINLGIVQFI